jgi:hypothetical protein
VRKQLVWSRSRVPMGVDWDFFEKSFLAFADVRTKCANLREKPTLDFHRGQIPFVGLFLDSAKRSRAYEYQLHEIFAQLSNERTCNKPIVNLKTKSSKRPVSSPENDPSLKQRTPVDQSYTHTHCFNGSAPSLVREQLPSRSQMEKSTVWRWI